MKKRSDTVGEPMGGGLQPEQESDKVGASAYGSPVCLEVYDVTQTESDTSCSGSDRPCGAGRLSEGESVPDAAR